MFSVSGKKNIRRSGSKQLPDWIRVSADIPAFPQRGSTLNWKYPRELLRLSVNERQDAEAIRVVFEATTTREWAIYTWVSSFYQKEKGKPVIYIRLNFSLTFSGYMRTQYISMWSNTFKITAWLWTFFMPEFTWSVNASKLKRDSWGLRQICILI